MFFLQNFKIIFFRNNLLIFEQLSVKLGGLKKTETGFMPNQDCMPETKGRTKLNENSNM